MVAVVDGDSASWRPTAELAALRTRAALLAQVRRFFAERGVLEVETPLLSSGVGTDPALEPLQTNFTGPGHAAGLRLFLQTSPEFAMKRLLAAGSGPIYQICKAFRNGELGRRHNPEFSILEWYRPGWDHDRLIEELIDLVRSLLDPQLPVERIEYCDLFHRRWGLDPLEAPLEALRAVAVAEGIPGAASIDLQDRDQWLDLLLSQILEPELGRGCLTVLEHYPASQAALARLHPQDPRLAHRFELYCEGLELANGYHELADAAEQRQRFQLDRELRLRRGQPELPGDQRLLAALEAGLPDCSGVAVGLDRILMLRSGAQSIEQVLAFPLSRA